MYIECVHKFLQVSHAATVCYSCSVYFEMAKARHCHRDLCNLGTVWNRFQSTTTTTTAVALSSQSPSGPAGGAPDGYGLGRGAAGPGTVLPPGAAPSHVLTLLKT